MLKFSRWKTTAILGLTILVCLAAVPSALPNEMFAHLPAWAQRKFELGYDLTGGSRVQLEVKAADVKRLRLEILRNDIDDLLRRNKVAHIRVAVRDGGVEFAVRDLADLPRALTVLDPLISPLAEPAPPNERRRLLTTNVDGRPSAWASPNPQLPQPNLAMEIAEKTVRSTLTDAALRGYIARGRDAGAKFIDQRLEPLGLPYRLQLVGNDRLVFETPVSVDRLNQMQH